MLLKCMRPARRPCITFVFALRNGAEGWWSQADVIGQLPYQGFGREIRLSNLAGGQY